jgi:DNA adenine methylase
VRAWALANGDNRLLRIALCGYAGEHDELVDAGWSTVAWKARGGYGSQGDGRGRENATRERIWFSPHCLNGEQGDLLATLEAA